MSWWSDKITSPLSASLRGLDRNIIQPVKDFSMNILGNSNDSPTNNINTNTSTNNANYSSVTNLNFDQVSVDNSIKAQTTANEKLGEYLGELINEKKQKSSNTAINFIEKFKLNYVLLASIPALILYYSLKKAKKR